MSDLWLQFPDDFKMCQRCVGTGSVRSGYGGTEYVMCSSCGGSGCVQTYGTKRTRRRGADAAETDEPVKKEKSEEGLWREMLDERIEIEIELEQCERYGLHSELAARWSDRLKKIDTTSPEAEAELNALKADVQRFSDESVSAFEMSAADELLVSKLSLICARLELMSTIAAQYQRLFSRQEPRTLREKIEALATASGPESVVKCPGCDSKMKAKNLRLHFDKKHWWKETGTA
ncbi:MAG TPA: hypothetical protein VJT74_09775 [Pyrinomonadaceae bacterium]|nr:hypothetical protein [Pyrinomonadaceae bacterium]